MVDKRPCGLPRGPCQDQGRTGVGLPRRNRVSHLNGRNVPTPCTRNVYLSGCRSARTSCRAESSTPEGDVLGPEGDTVNEARLRNSGRTYEDYGGSGDPSRHEQGARPCLTDRAHEGDLERTRLRPCLRHVGPRLVWTSLSLTHHSSKETFMVNTGSS